MNFSRWKASLTNTEYLHQRVSGLRPSQPRLTPPRGDCHQWYRRKQQPCYYASSSSDSHENQRRRRKWNGQGERQRYQTVGPSLLDHHRRRAAFDVLRIPPDSSFDSVKRAFVELALEHHPDRTGGSSSTDDFLRIREAFETIRDGAVGAAGDGDGVDVGSAPTGWSEGELREWFRRETGEYLCFEMVDDTRREVIDVYNTMARGGNDRGGYWDMARQLAEREIWLQDEMSTGEDRSGSGTKTKKKKLLLTANKDENDDPAHAGAAADADADTGVDGDADIHASKGTTMRRRRRR